MSGQGVAATVHVGRTSARAAASAPAWVWIALTLGVGLLAWSWTRARADDKPDWLDPNNPPISAPQDFSTTLLGTIATAPGCPTGGHKAPKKYPWGSLMGAPCCWVGDC